MLLPILQICYYRRSFFCYHRRLIFRFTIYAPTWHVQLICVSLQGRELFDDHGEDGVYYYRARWRVMHLGDERSAQDFDLHASTNASSWDGWCCCGRWHIFGAPLVLPCAWIIRWMVSYFSLRCCSCMCIKKLWKLGGGQVCNIGNIVGDFIILSDNW
jgi:hypothetical protein